MSEGTIAELELFIKQRFGDLVSEAELALLHRPAGFEQLKQLLAERCRRQRNTPIR